MENCSPRRISLASARLSRRNCNSQSAQRSSARNLFISSLTKRAASDRKGAAGQLRRSDTNHSPINRSSFCCFNCFFKIVMGFQLRGKRQGSVYSPGRKVILYREIRIVFPYIPSSTRPIIDVSRKLSVILVTCVFLEITCRQLFRNERIRCALGRTQPHRPARFFFTFFWR